MDKDKIEEKNQEDDKSENASEEKLGDLESDDEIVAGVVSLGKLSRLD